MIMLAARLLCMISLCSACAADAAPPILDHQLLQQADEILATCRMERIANLGVLKFRARRVTAGTLEAPQQLEPIPGPFENSIAQRLEFALIIRNSVDNPVGILRNASAEAAAAGSDNHLTASGRSALLDRSYPLAWGEAEVRPDAFVSGVVLFDADMREMHVALQMFTAAKPDLQPLAAFRAVPTPAELIDAAASFHTRGLFDGGRTEPSESKTKEAAAKQASAVLAGQAQHPQVDPEAPVLLTVLRNGQPVPVEFSAGIARIPEPSEGDDIAIRIDRRQADDTRRYALVLKVNGENTLFRERLPAADCRKWLMNASQRSMVIEGYQTSADLREKFKVLSQSESRAKSFSYGEDSGLISLTVFAEKTGVPAAEPGDTEGVDEDFALLANARYGQTPRPSLGALKFAFRKSAGRGVLDGGKQETNRTVEVPFQFYPVPLMSTTIVYYQR
jgi:hypothetical protein